MLTARTPRLNKRQTDYIAYIISRLDVNPETRGRIVRGFLVPMGDSDANFEPRDFIRIAFHDDTRIRTGLPR